MGKFIVSHYKYLDLPELSNNKSKALKKIGFAEISKQVEILRTSVGIVIELSNQESKHLKEMSLVRNLGLHNRWEVDEYYLDQTESIGWELRQIRTFDISELEMWHKALISLIAKTWRPVAIKFNGKPIFKI